MLILERSNNRARCGFRQSVHQRTGDDGGDGSDDPGHASAGEHTPRGHRRDEERSGPPARQSAGAGAASTALQIVEPSMCHAVAHDLGSRSQLELLQRARLVRLDRPTLTRTSADLARAGAPRSLRMSSAQRFRLP
jgi:hypothetical protein